MTRRMQHVANVATRRKRPSRGSAFLKLHPEELDVLGVLDAWMFKCFCAIVLMADFRSGLGDTFCQQVIRACAPIQPANGGPRRFVPSEWCVRDALLRFERARILQRLTSDSELQGRIVYRVSSRVGNFDLR